MKDFKFSEEERKRLLINLKMSGIVVAKWRDDMIEFIELIVSTRLTFELKQMEVESEWIDVSIPAENGKSYLVSDGLDVMGTIRKYNDGVFYYACGIKRDGHIDFKEDDTVKLYLPLPQPPKAP